MFLRLPSLELRFIQWKIRRSGAGQEREAAFHVLHDLAVQDHDADQRDQVVAAPVALNKSLARTGRAAERGVGPELRVHDVDRRGQRALGRVLAEAMHLAAFDDGDLAMFQMFQLTEQRVAAGPLQPRVAGDQGGRVGKDRRSCCCHGVTVHFG